MWLLLFAVCAASPVDECPCAGCRPSPASRATRLAFTSEAVSANFLVRSLDRRCSAETVARAAEAQRAHLYCHWQEVNEARDWNPRCEVVVHASRSSYLAAVGRGGESTFGSSWLDLRAGKCLGRRIDLLTDSQSLLSALPHELTHVVVCDMLGGHVPPRWLDEGMALLADSAEKQALHDRDLSNAQSRQLTFRAAELLNVDAYPHPSRVPAFYAQSRSLTAFLAGRGKPSLLLKFAEIAGEQGPDQALRALYGIDGVAELERAWLGPRSSPISYQLARSKP